MIGTFDCCSVPTLPSAPGWSGTCVRRSSNGRPSPQACGGAGSVDISWVVTPDGPHTKRAATITGAAT